MPSLYLSSSIDEKEPDLPAATAQPATGTLFVEAVVCQETLHVQQTLLPVATTRANAGLPACHGPRFYAH